MKAGIAIAMLATRALLETGAALGHRIVMLWTTDEEVGSESSRAAIEDEARRSRAVLVLEPSLPGGAVKTSRKGCGSYQVIVRGVAAHAGIEPQKGASAVQELAHQILRINAMQDLARGHLRQRRAGVGRAALERDPGRSAGDRRRPRADGRGRGRESTPPFARCAPSTAGPRSRRAAGSTVRRWNAPAWWSVCTSRPATSRGSWARNWRKAARAADRTGISPPRSGFRP